MFRGGRSGGRGAFHRFAKEEKYEVFPEIKELPVVNFKLAKEMAELVKCTDELRKFWISSPYYLEDPKNDERTVRKPPLSDYIKMTIDYFPGELVGKNPRPSKKTRWDLKLDLEKLDLFEKLDQKAQGKDDEEKKEEDEDEDPENVENDEEDDNDDYAENGGFDDDEDDYNMSDDPGDDEGCY